MTRFRGHARTGRLVTGFASLLLAIVLVSGCGGDTEPEALTVEEYAAWCVGMGSQPVPEKGDSGADLAAGTLTEIEGIEPPPELRRFHSALTGNAIALVLLSGELEEGVLAEGEDALDGLSLLAGLFDRAFEREVAALAPDVRAALEEAECLGRGFGEAVATATPPPTAEAGGTLVEGVPNGPPSWRTLELVIARDELRCGVKQTQPLFGFREADGTLSGFDIEFCKAIAAAVLGDGRKVHYVDASSASTRFELLADAEIDVLIRTTTLTASRDRERGVDYAQPIFYTGQGFLVRRDSGIASTSDMGDATICVQSGTTTEQNLADHFTDIGLEYDPQGGIQADVTDAFFDWRCDVLTEDAAALASRISIRDDADDYIVLPQIISKEPLAPGVRDYDSEWKDVVNWVVQGLIAAEEMGITRANVGSLAANPPNQAVARLLGVSYKGSEVQSLGFDRVDAQFIQRAIAAVGNYGEIYERTVGDYIPRTCTLNALVINNDGCPAGQGGIMYALPYR